MSEYVLKCKEKVTFFTCKDCNKFLVILQKPPSIKKTSLFMIKFRHSNPFDVSNATLTPMAIKYNYHTNLIHLKA